MVSGIVQLLEDLFGCRLSVCQDLSQLLCAHDVPQRGGGQQHGGTGRVLHVAH